MRLLIILCLFIFLLEITRRQNQIEEGFARTVKPNKEQFADAKFYQYDSDTDDPTGMDKCLTDCSGACIEYGISWSAWCIPPYNTDEDNTDNVDDLTINSLSESKEESIMSSLSSESEA